REPERGNLRQDLALVGDPGPEHVIERRDAIGGDDQQTVVEIVDVADLALSIRTSVSECGLENGRGERQRVPLRRRSASYRVRATAVGSAASTVLPARAGEVIRPYFLARQARHDPHGRMTATGAFATIILERLLDVVTVLVLLASFVFVFGKDLAGVNPTGFAVVKWAGVSAGAIST